VVPLDPDPLELTEPELPRPEEPPVEVLGDDVAVEELLTPEEEVVADRLPPVLLERLLWVNVEVAPRLLDEEVPDEAVDPLEAEPIAEEVVVAERLPPVVPPLLDEEVPTEEVDPLDVVPAAEPSDAAREPVEREQAPSQSRLTPRIKAVRIDLREARRGSVS
jgi:hypothetical protein